MEGIQEFLTKHELYDDVILWGTRIVAALAVFIIGRWVAKAITKAVKGVVTRRVDIALAGFFGNIVYAGLLAAVTIAALEQLGVETTSLLAILGAAGLAVGLAMKDSLSNFASGVMLMVLRPFKAGDLVEVAGKLATVEHLQVFHTLLVTLNGESLWIPNATITSDEIINYSTKPIRRVDIHVQISYGDDIKKARDVMQRVIDADERVLEDPAPQILVVELGDNGIDMRVRPWVQTADWWATYCEMTEAIKEALEKEGITIPFPQRDVHMHEAQKAA